jgi:hypothetical protein
LPRPCPCRRLVDESAGQLRLLVALLNVGAWEHALVLLDWIKVGGCVVVV